MLTLWQENLTRTTPPTSVVVEKAALDHASQDSANFAAGNLSIRLTDSKIEYLNNNNNQQHRLI